MKQFLKVEDLQLINGGYLSNKEGKPVYNAEFIAAQQHAHFIAELAKEAEGKDFKGKEADSIEEVKQTVLNRLSSVETVEFIKGPKKFKQDLTDKLKSEALGFINFNEEVSKTAKINEFLQSFKVIDEFEKFGLFFEEEIVKLNKIYTIKEIVKNTKLIIDLV
jgi:hypothetical protein